MHRRTLSELTTRTSQYPELSLGDLVARCFHDWDNAHGLAVEVGGVVFGDGHIDKGATKDLALAGVRAGNDDISIASEMGASGSGRTGEALYRAVQEATGTDGDVFRAERKVPRVSAANPAQNWQARDAESLWGSPIVGTRGTTVGEALIAMLEPGGQFIRQLDMLGRGLSGAHGIFAVPFLGSWLSDKCCQAYHDGFVKPLAHDPGAALLALVQDAGSSPGDGPGAGQGLKPGTRTRTTRT